MQVLYSGLQALNTFNMLVSLTICALSFPGNVLNQSITKAFTSVHCEKVPSVPFHNGQI